MFNWFRRQFGDHSPEDKEQNQKTEAKSQEAKPTESESVQQEVETQQEDYLKWAKAAYQNIQQRKAEEKEEEQETIQENELSEPVSTAVTPTETPVVEREITTAESELEPVSTAVTPTETPVVEREITTAESELEPVSTAVTPTETPVVEREITTAESELEPVSTAVTPTETPVVEREITTAESELEPVSTAVTPTETPVVEREITTAESELEPVSTAVTPTETPVVEREITAPESELEPVSAAVTPTETPVVEREITTAESELETTSDFPATPAWMRKSDGLERLKETAIELPTPEEEKQKPVQTADEIAFDEEFVWSAQVLAAQGRTPEDISEEEITWLKRLRQGLGKTRRSLINQLKSIVGQGPLNEDAVMEIEALLLQADVGIEATDYIINTLQDKLREEALPPEQAIAYLKTILRELLDKPFENLENPEFVPEKDILNIWLITGVNGAGKTTTIGKLAHLAQKSGYTCVIAAADTFRAAAVEQVKIWGERSNTPVIANPGKNTDPAAVVFDGITAAQAHNTELLLVDTAGRLQNKKNLMDELAKIRRIIDKKASNAKVESLLVLDATLGQNGLRQAQVFSEAAKLSGVVLTKLDSSAKGGVALAVTQQLNLPIRFVGAGEGIEDLRPFSSYEFVEALLNG